MKRIISMILAVVMVLAVMPVSVFAASEIASGTCGNNLTWTLTDDGVLTIGGTGEMENYYDSSAPWYSYSSSIKSVIIEDGVTSIGNYAFLYCSSLTSITIPDSVTNIGDYAFYWCTSLMSVTIGNGVTAIGDYAFYGCSSLTSVHITDLESWCNISFSSYNSNPLSYAKNLYLNGELVTDLVIPDGVTSIGNYAFRGCSSLTSITIPDSVTSIGLSAFSGCSSLTSITIPDSVTYIGGGAFSGCSSLTSITIPDGVTSIGGSAFWYCLSLTSITIPDSVTSIGNQAFEGCLSLTSITIPDSVINIGSYAFWGCSNITSIIIPQNVSSIGWGAFINCSSLSEITFMSSQTSIYDDPETVPATATIYGYNDSLAEAYAQMYDRTFVSLGDAPVTTVASGTCGENLTWELNSKGVLTISGTGDMYDYTRSSDVPWDSYHDVIGEIIIPAGLTMIDSMAIGNCNAKSIFVDDANTVYCDIDGILYNKDVTELICYPRNSTITDLVLPETLLTINQWIVANNLVNITCPEFLGSISLWSVPNLETIKVMSLSTKLYDVASDVTIHAYEGSTAQEYAIANSNPFVSLGQMPEKVIASGDCGENLTWELTNYGVLTISGTGAMYAYGVVWDQGSITAVNNVPWATYCDQIKKVTFEEGVTEISAFTFRYVTEFTSNGFSYKSMNNLEEIDICASMEYFPLTVSCASLVSINVADSNEYYCDVDGILYDKSMTTLIMLPACHQITDFEIPSTVTTVTNSIDNSNLKSIIFPVSVSTAPYIQTDSLESITFLSPSTYIYDSQWAIVAPNATIYGYNDSTAEAYAQMYDRTFVSLGDAPVTTIASGTCGENLTWELNSKGVLTISGTGEMDDYYSTSSVPWYSYRSSIKSVIIEDSVTSIGDSAFEDCTKLINVTIPDSVTSIGYSAFWGCSNITSITIPDSVINIGWYAFDYCSSLTSIIIPQNVSSIGWGTFRSCNSLSEITFTSSLTSIYDDPEAVPATATIYGYNDSTAEAYAQMYDRTFVSLGDAPVTTIASGTCGENLTWELNSKGVLTISGTGDMYDYTRSSDVPWYSYSSSIKSVIIEDSVTSIGYGAFSRCSNLTSITIPDSVTNIGNNALFSCSNLITIEVDDANEYYADIDGVLFDKSLSTLIQYPAGKTQQSYTIPESVKTIEQNAFNGCSSLMSITIPEGLQVIRDLAFQSCSGIVEIVIPQHVSSIGWGAFISCNSLSEITFTSSLTSIYDDPETVPATATIYGYNDSPAEAYAQKYDRTFVSLGDAPVTTVASGTCGENLTWELNSKGVLTISGTGEMDDYGWIYENGNVVHIDAPWQDFETAIREIIIENGVTSIGKSAFIGYSNLSSVTISDSVTSIGGYAFSNCSRLTSINIPDSVTSIGDSAFVSCSSLTSVTIPNSVTYIGWYAFAYCSSLTAIEVDDTNEYYADVDGVLFDKSLSTLIQYPAGKTQQSYVIPDGVISVGDSAFEDCANLINITIPDSVTSIGNYAFWGCSNITSITIPESVGSIGDYAFYDCVSLESVIFKNPNIEIYDDTWTVCDNAVIYGYDNSTAQAYAEKYGKEFVSLGSLAMNGNLDGNLTVDKNDAIYLLYSVLFGEDTYPLNQTCDFNGDGSVDKNDAIYLLYHALFGAESYPLN